MFGPQRNAASVYANVSVDTCVSQAEPHRLIDLLFQRAQDLLATADAAIVSKDIATKGESITKVLRILDEGLRAALNPEAGEISQNLRSLYDYCMSRLLKANIDNDREIIQEVRTLLGEVHAGWRGIAPNATSTVGTA
ncbi:MAG: flagellar export chaperone FliS [Burkholderiaceae bacterium]